MGQQELKIFTVIIFSLFLRMAVKAAAEENDEFERLCVYVAQDCAGM